MKNFFDSFLLLVDALLSGKLAPAEFKLNYMKLWRECRDDGGLEVLNAATHDAFDRFFTTSDAYCEDSSLHDLGNLDERQFLEAIKAIAADVPR